MSGNCIILTGSEVYIPTEVSEAYRVEKGTVRIFIAPWKNGKTGRRLLLCEVSSARMIPSFVFRDQEYVHWRFVFQAADGVAELVRLQNSVTSILHRNFLQIAGISTYEQEKFEGSLVEFYKKELLKDYVFISLGEHAEPIAKVNVEDEIMHAFRTQEKLPSGECPEFLAFSFLCKRMGLPVLDADQFAVRCGKSASIEQVAGAFRVICRKVVLEQDWYKHDCGALIGKIGNEIVACIPGKKGEYEIFYTEGRQAERLTSQTAHLISPQAYSLGRTLPHEELSRKDILRFCKKSIRQKDILAVAILELVCALIGILLPTLNQMIYDDYIPLGNLGELGQLCVVMLSFMIGNVFFSIVKNLSGLRLTDRIGNELQNAAYYRLFRLPEQFFRDYDSADLASRIMSIAPVTKTIANTFILTGLSALLSIVYLFKMFTYSGKLTWIGIGMYVAYSLLIFWLSMLVRKRENKIMEAEGEASGKLYQYLNGVDKIRMAGVEERAMLSYMRPYAKQQAEEIKKNRVLSGLEVITSIISTVFSMVLYIIIVKNKLSLSVGSFIAFNTAFGSFTGALDGLLQELVQIYQEKDAVRRFWPVFAVKPEDDQKKEVPPRLSGALTLEHVSFSYTKGGKEILSDLSLSIEPGDYIGIVGASGGGKSTLLKLILAFEEPNAGMILVDGKDLRELDKSAYRRQLGVVLQNGKLIAGSIYENITITAPDATMEQVNRVIDEVGLREDINQMPMGLQTVLSENCNTISGGQQQRILIARAIISDPAILIFDEATSALDNMTQATVTSNLDHRKKTRIVVAHRLSTIKNCNRILVLQDGHIVEDGTFSALMDKGGLFYALARRQLVE